MPKSPRSPKPYSLIQSFSAHPKSVGETYGQHMVFAAGLGGQLLLAGLAAIVHGLVPGWFETTASDTVKKLGERTGPRRALAAAGQGENDEATTLAR